jgi:hypothetical protein
MKLTTHICLLPKIRMSRAVGLLLCMPLWNGQRDSHTFSFYNVSQIIVRVNQQWSKIHGFAYIKVSENPNSSMDHIVSHFSA